MRRRERLAPRAPRRERSDEVSLVSVGVQNIDLLIDEHTSQLADCRSAELSVRLDDVGLKAELARNGTEGRLEIGRILDHAHERFDLLRRQMLDEREDPPLRAVQPGGAPHVQHSEGSGRRSRRHGCGEIHDATLPH